MTEPQQHTENQYTPLMPPPPPPVFTMPTEPATGIPPFFAAQPPVSEPAPQHAVPPAIAAANARPAALDLDKLEREGTPAPFDFILNERRYIMSDPQEVDWQDLMAAFSNPHMFFRLVLPPEDRSTFFDQRLPSWKMNKLVASYQDHYGIPPLPNAGGLPR